MAQQPIVTVSEGQLKGKIVPDFYGGQYYCFQGIPYAKPPIDKLRFKAPQPPEPWSGIKDATSEGNECYSRHMVSEKMVGSEDCLFLNVYTTELPSNDISSKPVMVWIHGGGFICGSGNSEIYGPDFLLAHDVVFVSINYRLGLLGFLSLEDPSLEIPGNAGLKDQVLALKWIQKNISKFGGDPNNVTIFGESAGGVSVHFLMLSPMAQGLFHKAIIQSGSALGSYAIAQCSTHAIAKALELTTSDEKEILKILMESSVEKVLEIQEKIPINFTVNEVHPHGPVVEKPSTEPAFLEEEPFDIISSGRYNKVPLMVGYTTREGMLSAIATKTIHGEIRLITDFEESVPHMMKLSKGNDLSKKISEDIKMFYYGDAEPSLSNIDQYYMLQTDNFFLRPIHSAVKLQAANSSTPIYFYRMSVDSTLNIYKIMYQITHAGVCHADDVGYLFKTFMTPPIRPRSIEDDSVRRFTKLWTNFARTGNPNSADNDPLINVTWKPVEKDQIHFLDIGENLTVGINPESARMQFWDKMYNLTSETSTL